MIGIELDAQARTVAERCLDHGLAVTSTRQSVLRLLPPYIVTEFEIDQAMDVLDRVLAEC